MPRPIPVGGRRFSLTAGLLAACCVPISTRAQTSLPSNSDRPIPVDDDRRLDRLERRLEALEEQHREDLRARDAEIARLRTQLEAHPPAAATQPAGGAPQTSGSPTVPEPSTIQKTRQAILEDIEANHSSPLTLRTPANFNPDFAVVSDFLASYSSNRDNDALNRLDIRELELDLRAAVDPRADGVAILAFERDAENPVFPEDEPLEGPESSVNIEEAFLFLHDFGVPNLTAKLGRFHLRFGRQNILHLHDLPTSDPPLVNQAFLSPESLNDAGLSLSYLVPPHLTAGQAVELVAEVLAAEGSGSESAVFTGDITADSPALNLHALWNTDLSRVWNLELGGSFLTGPRGPDNSQRANVFGADVTLVRRDPTGGFNNLLLQSEVMYGDVDQDDGTNEQAFGFYALGQQQLNRDWYLGLRLDYTQDPNDSDSEAYGFSPYVSWYWSEFLRFRLQYQHKRGDVPTENNLYMQATWIFGAHPPHPYWSMR